MPLFSIRHRLAVAAAAALILGAAPAWADMSSAVRRTTHEVKGLAAPAEIILDFWGIPHICAASTEDAFFLQGYNAARDRLWQIDLWRKRGLGLLAKDFGPSYVRPGSGGAHVCLSWRHGPGMGHLRAECEALRGGFREG